MVTPASSGEHPPVTPIGKLASQTKKPAIALPSPMQSHAQGTPSLKALTSHKVGVVKGVISDTCHKAGEMLHKIFPRMSSAFPPSPPSPSEVHAPTEKKEPAPSPLIQAIMQGNLTAVQTLAGNENINQPDHTGRSPLFIAIDCGHEAIAKFLIQRGADANLADKRQMTPLMSAVAKNFESIVELLLQAGANPNHPDANGYPPLFYIFVSGNLKIGKLLCDAGAQVDCQANGRKTPLIIAAYLGHKFLVEFLIERGADINQADRWDATPLMYASDRGHLEVVRLLLEKGALANKVDKSGESALIQVISQRLKFHHALQKNIETHAPAEAIYAGEFLARAHISHIAELKGKTDLILAASGETRSIKVEGRYAEEVWAKIAKDVANFNATLHLIRPSTERLLRQACHSAAENHSFSSKQKYQKWRAGRPVILQSGYEGKGEHGHHISILLWKDRLVVCNRGEGASSDNGIASMQFDTSRMTMTHLESLLAEKHHNLAGFLDSLEKFKTDLWATKTAIDETLEMLPLSLQKVGNCAWANSAGLLLPFLVIDENMRTNGDFSEISVGDIEQIFALWQKFALLNRIEEYLNGLSEASIAQIVPAFDLIATVLAQSAVEMEKDSTIISEWQETIVSKWQETTVSKWQETIFSKWQEVEKHFLQLAPSDLIEPYAQLKAVYAGIIKLEDIFARTVQTTDTTEAAA